MALRAFVFGLIHLVYFELFFLIANQRLLLIFLFLVLAIYSLHEFLSVMESNGARRSVLIFFFLCLFAFSLLYLSVVEVVYLRHVGAVGFSLFSTFVILLLSSGKGDIRQMPRFFVDISITIVSVLFIFSASFFHSLKMFFQIRNAWWPFLISLLHALIVYLLFLSFKIDRRAIIPSVFAVFLITLQCFWIIEFLPFGPLVSGILQCIPVILFILIEKDRLLDRLKPKEYIRFSVISVLLIVLILLFARWS